MRDRWLHQVITPVPPTDNQLNYIKALEGQTGVRVGKPTTKKQASDYLDRLLTIEASILLTEATTMIIWRKDNGLGRMV